MEMTNLSAAYTVLQLDNLPQFSEDDFTAYVAPHLLAAFPAAQLQVAEDAIAALRQPGDLDNIASPLWQVVAGGEGHHDKVSEEVNEVINEMFDMLGQ